MARLVLADLPVRAGMTPLPPWVPHAVPCSLAIDIRFHRTQAADLPAPPSSKNTRSEEITARSVAV